MSNFVNCQAKILDATEEKYLLLHLLENYLRGSSQILDDH